MGAIQSSFPFPCTDILSRVKLRTITRNFPLNLKESHLKPCPLQRSHGWEWKDIAWVSEFLFGQTESSKVPSSEYEDESNCYSCFLWGQLRFLDIILQDNDLMKHIKGSPLPVYILALLMKNVTPDWVSVSEFLREDPGMLSSLSKYQ